MRYTRNRQLFKLTGHKHWKETYNIPMWESRKWSKELDPTFEWIRSGIQQFVFFVPKEIRDSDNRWDCPCIHVKELKK